MLVSALLLIVNARGPNTIGWICAWLKNGLLCACVRLCVCVSSKCRISVKRKMNGESGHLFIRAKIQIFVRHFLQQMSMGDILSLKNIENKNVREKNYRSYLRNNLLAMSIIYWPVLFSFFTWKRIPRYIQLNLVFAQQTNTSPDGKEYFSGKHEKVLFFVLNYVKKIFRSRKKGDFHFAFPTPPKWKIIQFGVSSAEWFFSVNPLRINKLFWPTTPSTKNRLDKGKLEKIHRARLMILGNRNRIDYY